MPEEVEQSDSGTTTFGALVDELRRSRGLSKEGLARVVGVSRVHLWRACTGRSALSEAELLRVADALVVSRSRLDRALLEDQGGQWEPDPERAEPPAGSEQDEEIERYLSNLGRILVTLRNFPGGEMGRRLKLEYLNGVEEIAREVGQKLPPRYWDVRRRVQEGEPL